MTQDLNKFKESIQFVNEMVKAADSYTDFANFYELVKSRKRKDIDDAEFYGLAYEFLGGDFALMKKLGNVLKDETTPSYIRLPATTSGAGDNNQVLNNSCSIYSYKVCASDVQCDPYYIYRPSKVIEKSRCMPSTINNGATAVEWWESRRSELELVLHMLTKAKKEVKRVLKKFKRGKSLKKVKLRDHLVERGVKVKLLEKMFWDLEKLMVQPLESLPIVVVQLRRLKEEVVEAIRQLNQLRT